MSAIDVITRVSSLPIISRIFAFLIGQQAGIASVKSDVRYANMIQMWNLSDSEAYDMPRITVQSNK